LQEAASHLFGSPWLLVAILVIVFFAAIVQFGLGMGFGMTASPLLAVLDPQLVPAPVLLVSFATAFITAAREHEHIVWREIWIGSAGRLIGVAIATLVLAGLTDRDSFSLVFGLMVALAVLFSISGWRLRFSNASLTAMAMISGIMATISSVGAPPLAIIYQDRVPGQARPTLAAFFTAGCALSLAGLYLSGWAGMRDLVLAAIMVPGMVSGLIASQFLKHSFDARFRPVLLAISGAAACLLIVRGLT
jgi:uncharacterized membrane protein YfcA